MINELKKIRRNATNQASDALGLANLYKGTKNEQTYLDQAEAWYRVRELIDEDLKDATHRRTPNT